MLMDLQLETKNVINDQSLEDSQSDQVDRTSTILPVDLRALGQD